MPLPSSGSISLSQVNVELGRSASATISMNESAVRTLFGVGASGAIAMNQGLGKANQFAFAIASNVANVNLRDAAVAAGWNGTSKVVATINSGVTVFSNSTGSYALTINGSFPGGVELINNGTILGRGGNGGNYGGGSGGSGGPGLLVQTAVSITNNGRISGGGGGGGGGGWRTICGAEDGENPGQCLPGWLSYYWGGAGGGGIGNGPGGSAYGGYPSNSGSLTSAGSGANGEIGAPGGSGGTYGSSGASGSSGCVGGYWSCGGGGGGGTAGAAVAGNSNITWIATGTRNGSIS